MKTRQHNERIKFFGLGLLVALAIMLLAGATDVGPPSYGRYQIASWGTEFGSKGGGFGVFIADTATGETKMVYSRVFGETGNGEIKKDELGKTFFSIK
ncbi:MAG: hypothetical protein A2X84_02565 [Desulfuromonadaceae bacterium GWC2_58_13]|nr:MAG: hypothetical protein A2X84_02565 [Desulfuromonadaceae bacterium GWC2_58_13]